MSTSTQISAADQRNKSRKTDYTQLDYISNLPDGVIAHILSRLRTSYAVRTSVLSKDWRYKWTTIYNIHLNHFQYEKDSLFEEDTFRKFVERTFRLTGNLQSFQLSCTGTHRLTADFETWIFTALSRDIHFMEIIYREARIVFPTNHVKFYFLRRLRLDVPCTFKVSSKVSFPHLTTLRLQRVEILNEVSIFDRVELNFAVLETFELVECKWLDVKFVEIYAPKLTRFYSVTKGGTPLSEYTIRIVGDSLVKFESHGGLPENIVFSGGSGVVYAELNNSSLSGLDNVKKESGFRIRKLLNGFSGLKHLRLSESISEVIALSKPTGLSCPKYYNVERLQLFTLESGRVLLELLHAVPFLKVLNVTAKTLWVDYDYDAEESMPSCLASHLEEVTLWRFPRMMYEMRLAKFFCKYAANLKSMHVSCGTVGKELSTYPKVSTCLTIVVY